jgi:hypothetical protein
MSVIQTADDRRKAREAYLAALAAQKASIVSQPDRNQHNLPQPVNLSSVKPNPPQPQLMDKRQEAFEEKRQQFLTKQNEASSTSWSKNPLESTKPSFHGMNSSNLDHMPQQQQVPSSSNQYHSSNNPPINLKNYQQAGYPSEYAYALASGGLEIPKQSSMSILRNDPAAGQHERLREPPRFALAAQASEHPPHTTNHYPVASIESHQPDNSRSIMNIGYHADDRERKRQIQQQYAHELQSQINHRQHQQHQSSSTTVQVQGIAAIGQRLVDDKAYKRQQQQEYARELEQQIQEHRSPSKFRDHSSHEHQHQSYQGVNAIGEKLSDKEFKRQKQEEYRHELEKQLQAQKSGQHHHQQGKGNSKVSSIDQVGERVTDKELKRLEQQEYARELESQLKHKSQHDDRSSASLMNDGGDGWVIGPLGIPVRKTLDVGDRKLQRQYYQRQAASSSSPNKPVEFKPASYDHNAAGPSLYDVSNPYPTATAAPYPGRNSHYMDSMSTDSDDYYPVHGRQQQPYEAPPGPHTGPAAAVIPNGLGMDSQEERNAKQKQKQVTLAVE